VSGIRRALRRRAGRTGGIADLSEAQRELVRLVSRHPGIHVGEAASELSLAPNTVSTLVGVLRASGWLRRETDPADARSASLSLTSDAVQRVAAWRDRRLAVLNEALAELPAEDHAAISQALPALRRLSERLQERP
jgi:DNA-binding MarR family transcriptional regulator